QRCPLRLHWHAAGVAWRPARRASRYFQDSGSGMVRQTNFRRGRKNGHPPAFGNGAFQAEPGESVMRTGKETMRTRSRKAVAVIGIWHLGAVNAVGFAEKGYTVLGIEFDKQKAASLQQGKAPLFEPGLEQLMACHLKKRNLRFDSDP